MKGKCDLTLRSRVAALWVQPRPPRAEGVQDMEAPHENDDLTFISDWMAAYSLRTERFSSAETRQGKTPDFRIFRDDKLAAYCEVKSPRDSWLDDQIEDAAPCAIMGGSRPDPTFNRIASHVEKAARQFDSVNPAREFPNILCFVNWDAENDFQDLEETLTGYLSLQGGQRAPTMLNVAEGRSIGGRKHRIDLYVWFHGPTKRLKGMFFGSSRVFEKELCGWFQLDPCRVVRN